MDENKILKCGADMIHLASSALRGATPDKNRAQEMDVKAISKMASFHSMQAITYIALADLAEKDAELISDTETLSMMRADYGRALSKLFSLEMEREALTKFLEEKKIWYLPLKGIILKDYYPKLGMRQMTDNDILINPKFAKDVRSFLVDRGYTVLDFGKGCHDIYQKGTVIFEIHRKLAADTKKNQKKKQFCNEIVEKAIKSRVDSYKLTLTDEDFYVYFIFHTYKHFSSSGCGIRSLMDIYLYMQKKMAELDMEYVENKLSSLGLYEFERKTRELAFLIFSPEPSELYSALESLSPEMHDLLLYFLSSGTFGTSEQLIKNTLTDISNNEEITTRVKLKYFFRRLFPPFEFYKLAYPKLHKFIVTIPFLWFFRLLRGIRKSDKVSNEIKNLKKIK